MGPPTFILMNLYQLHHPLSYAPDGRPIQPPSNCPETQIPATDDLSTYFICIPWLFRVYPPTREEELGRVLRTKTISGHERIRAQRGDLQKPKPGDIAHPASFSVEQDCDDDGDSDDVSLEDENSDVFVDVDDISHDHASNPLPRTALPYPYPATAISCNDPSWPLAVETARDRARQQWLGVPQQPCPINHGPLKVGVDLTKEEMVWVQEYLPREDLKFVRTEHGFEDMRSRLQEVSTRKGCLLLNSFSTGSKGYVFVFDVSAFPCPKIPLIFKHLGRICSFWRRASTSLPSLISLIPCSYPPAGPSALPSATLVGPPIPPTVLEKDRMEPLRTSILAQLAFIQASSELLCPYSGE